MLKQTLIAGAALLLVAAPAMARGHHSSTSHSFNGNTVVMNEASVVNTVSTSSNTGNNVTSATGSTTANTQSGETERAHGGNTTGASNVAGAGNSVSTGDAFAGAYVSNTVNTTVVNQ